MATNMSDVQAANQSKRYVNLVLHSEIVRPTGTPLHRSRSARPGTVLWFRSGIPSGAA